MKLEKKKSIKFDTITDKITNECENRLDFNIGPGCIDCANDNDDWMETVNVCLSCIDYRFDGGSMEAAGFR